MFSKFLTSANKFCLKRSLVTASVSFAYDIYDLNRVSNSKSIYEIMYGPTSEDLMDIEIESYWDRHKRLEDKIIALNDGDTNVPDIRYGDGGPAYVGYNQTIILPEKGEINDFTLAHEFAHWKLGHCAHTRTNIAINTMVSGLLGAVPIGSLVCVATAFGLCMVPNYLRCGSIFGKGAELQEHAADILAIQKGFAKEGYDYFKELPVNINDVEHPFTTHRAALCYYFYNIKETKP